MLIRLPVITGPMPSQNIFLTQTRRAAEERRAISIWEQRRRWEAGPPEAFCPWGPAPFSSLLPAAAMPVSCTVPAQSHHQDWPGNVQAEAKRGFGPIWTANPSGEMRRKKELLQGRGIFERHFPILKPSALKNIYILWWIKLGLNHITPFSFSGRTTVAERTVYLHAPMTLGFPWCLRQ